jgi:hypothetical protein
VEITIQVGVCTNELFLLDEFDILQGLCGEFDGLVEAVLAAVRNVHQLDHFGLQPLVEHVRLAEFGFEVGAASQDEAGDVGLVTRKVQRHRYLGYFSHVVVPLLHTQTRKTQR